MPLARTVCSRVTETVIRQVANDGGVIPCGKGCLACCSFLVTLSVPEVFRFIEDIQALPSQQWLLMQRLLLTAARKILKNPPPNILAGQTSKSLQDSQDELIAISDWYRSLKLLCPFNCDGQCMIYDQRPMACREYFVNGSAQACKDGQDLAEVVPIPVRMDNVLGLLATELEGEQVEAVMMPLSLAWYEQNQHRDQRTWPAVEMVRRFAQIVEVIVLGREVAALRS